MPLANKMERFPGALAGRGLNKAAMRGIKEKKRHAGESAFSSFHQDGIYR